MLHLAPVTLEHEPARLEPWPRVRTGLEAKPSLHARAGADSGSPA